jgi:cytochrome c peroxidase
MMFWQDSYYRTRIDNYKNIVALATRKLKGICMIFKNSRLSFAILTSCGLLASSQSFAGEFTVTDADFHDRNEAKEKLGKFLMFDKILSGNKNISGATCHHPLAGLGDGLALPVGEGGKGLGVTRDTGTGDDAIVERVPRNAPHVFNLGAKEFTVLFHDGRVAADPAQPSGFATPPVLIFRMV